MCIINFIFIEHCLVCFKKFKFSFLFNLQKKKFFLIFFIVEILYND